MSDTNESNASTPVVQEADPHRREHDQLLDHEYDGIREYDNPLPLWWKGIFWGTFVFSIGYFFHYHVSGNGESVAAAYEADMREAREAEAKANLAQPVSEDSLGKLMADAALMTDAKALFSAKCAVCHGDKAQGLIGPNLTDNSWIHGRGTLTDIYGVINEGVLSKGMPAWGKQLSPIEVRKLAAYVGTQRGKSVPGKPPEGVAIGGGAAPADSAAPAPSTVAPAGSVAVPAAGAAAPAASAAAPAQ